MWKTTKSLFCHQKNGHLKKNTSYVDILIPVTRYILQVKQTTAATYSINRPSSTGLRSNGRYKVVLRRSNQAYLANEIRSFMIKESTRNYPVPNKRSLTRLTKHPRSSLHRADMGTQCSIFRKVGWKGTPIGKHIFILKFQNNNKILSSLIVPVTLTCSRDRLLKKFADKGIPKRRTILPLLITDDKIGIVIFELEKPPFTLTFVIRGKLYHHPHT